MFMHRDALYAPQHCDTGHGNRVNVGPECNQGRLRLIGKRNGIIEASYEKESVNPWTPFVMIAKACDWLLRFFDAKTRISRAGIEILEKIATFCFVVPDLQINCVLWRDLLLERN